MDTEDRRGFGRRVATAAALGVLLCAAYAPVLAELARLGMRRDLYSHVFLVPVISAYLIATQRRRIAAPFVPARATGFAALAVALASAATARALQSAGMPPSATDWLSLTVFSFVCALFGIAALGLGAGSLRPILFPLVFLLFLVPMPDAVEHGFEVVLQLCSAQCFGWLIRLTGTPLIQEGTIFIMPGLSLEVARECSGIRSSFVLFITGLLAAYLFLRTPWRRTVMALVFFPIGVLRNATRILFLALMAMHVDPTIMDGPVHHSGGPPWFVASLVPLFLVLFLLRRSERRAQRVPHAQPQEGGAPA